MLIIAGLLLTGISDSKASVANSVNQTNSHGSGSATLTITMRTPPLPEE